MERAIRKLLRKYRTVFVQSFFYLLSGHGRDCFDSFLNKGYGYLSRLDDSFSIYVSRSIESHLFATVWIRSCLADDRTHVRRFTLDEPRLRAKPPRLLSRRITRDSLSSFHRIDEVFKGRENFSKWFSPRRFLNSRSFGQMIGYRWPWKAAKVPFSVRVKQ